MGRLASLRKSASRKALPARTGKGPGAGPALVLWAGVAVMTAGLSLMFLQTDARVPDGGMIGAGAFLGLAGLGAIVTYFARWGKLTGGS